MKKIIFTQKQIEQIIYLYIKKEINMDKIAFQFNTCRWVINNLLKLNNVNIRPPINKRRKYQINDNFLDNINKEQAYFIGWVASDGSVGKNNEIKLSLQDRDLDIIEKLKYLLNFEGPIKINRIKGMKRGAFTANYNICGISIANLILATKLREFGYDNNKSYNLEFPFFLSKNLFSHFFRSFIEGDGSIVHQIKSNNIYVSFISTNKFCKDFKLFIKKELGINVYIEPIKTAEKQKSKTHSRAVINGNYNALVLLNYIYKDAFLYMNRKYNYYKDIVNRLITGNPQTKTRKQLKIAQNIIVENARYQK